MQPEVGQIRHFPSVQQLCFSQRYRGYQVRSLHGYLMEKHGATVDGILISDIILFIRSVQIYRFIFTGAVLN